MTECIIFLLPPSIDYDSTGFLRISLNFLELYILLYTYTVWQLRLDYCFRRQQTSWFHFSSSSDRGTQDVTVKPKSLYVLVIHPVDLRPHADKWNRIRAYFELLGVSFFHLLIMFSSLGLMKEKPAKAAWSMESMRFLSAWESLGFSLRNSRSKLLQSLGDFCGWQVRDFSFQVNVKKHTEVISILDACNHIYTNGFHIVCSETKS